MPINLKFLKKVQDEIKIIVLVRDVEEILASFIKWSQREPTSFVNRYAAKTVEEKCDMLMKTDGQIVKELIGVKHLLDHQPRDMYHIVEYNDLCDNPKQTIEGIYDFLGIYRFNHRYNNLDQFQVNGMKYDDNIVGQNLHTIETNSINSNNYNEFKENVNDILPKSIIEKYNILNFLDRANRMADDDKLKTALVNANDLDRNDLIIKSMADNPLVKEEYKGMLKNISTNLPAIKKSSSNFYKSHSQFMGVMLDVTAITPIRSIKHTLAELDKTRMALEEAHLKMMKKILS